MAWPGRATPVAHPARPMADTDLMEAVRRQPSHALLPVVRAATLACVLVAAIVLARSSRRRPARPRYGDGAAIPFLLLPADNPWNTPVDSLPLDPDSAGYIAHMDPATRPAPGLRHGVGRARPSASPTWWCRATQPKVPVSVRLRRRERPGSVSDPAVRAHRGRAPPPTAIATCSCSTPTTRSSTRCTTRTRRADGRGTAGSGAVFDLTSNALRPDGWTSADAAGLPILPGLVRYDEIVGEGVHRPRAALHRARTPQRAYVYPATHFASSLDRHGPAADGAARAAQGRLRHQRVPAGGPGRSSRR